MQPEQPNTPSQDAQPSDAATQDQGSDERQEGSSPGWWSRLFNRRPAQETTSDSGDSGEPGQAASKLSLTQEELDRRVQAETDRREAKRQQEFKAQERRRLRDENPWEYANQDRQAEEHATSSGQLQNFLAGIGSEHDKASIDPVMELLSEQERTRILKLEGAGQGLAGRKLVVREALKALEKQWKADGEKRAESRLRGNAAFRKEVLSQARGGFEEPELLPAFGGGASAADQKMSDILRGFYGVSRHNEAS